MGAKIDAIERLLDSERRNMSDEKLRAYAPYFNNPEQFLKQVGR